MRLAGDAEHDAIAWFYAQDTIAGRVWTWTC